MQMCRNVCEVALDLYWLSALVFSAWMESTECLSLVAYNGSRVWRSGFVGTPNCQPCTKLWFGSEVCKLARLQSLTPTLCYKLPILLSVWWCDVLVLWVALKNCRLFCIFLRWLKRWQKMQMCLQCGLDFVLICLDFEWLRFKSAFI